MFKKIVTKYKYQILLTIIVGVLFWVNYQSGTYLSGWDNLQTELNPWLAVKRAFFSVWEEYQSFGLTAGMAHAADLPRAIFLLIMSTKILVDTEQSIQEVRSVVESEKPGIIAIELDKKRLAGLLDKSHIKDRRSHEA